MVEIKRLQPGDERLACHVVARFKTRGQAKVPPVGDSMRRFLARDDVCLIVASQRGEPVGFLLAYKLPRIECDRDMVLLYEIEVSEPHRHSGIGKRLIADLKLQLESERILKMWVITAESNEAAMRLYRSTGAVRHKDRDIVVFDYLPEALG